MATPVETAPEAVELTLTDRCDACGAAAKTRAVKSYSGAVLLFCGHHAAEHGSALVAKGWEIK